MQRGKYTDENQSRHNVCPNCGTGQLELLGGRNTVTGQLKCNTCGYGPFSWIKPIIESSFKKRVSVMNMTERTIDDVLETWNNRYKKHAKRGDVRLALAVEQCIQELRYVYDTLRRKQK